MNARISKGSSLKKNKDPFMAGLNNTLMRLEKENLRIGLAIKDAANDCTSTEIEEMIEENPLFRELIMEQRVLIKRMVKASADAIAYIDKYGEGEHTGE